MLSDIYTDRSGFRIFSRGQIFKKFYKNFKKLFLADQIDIVSVPRTLETLFREKFLRRRQVFGKKKVKNAIFRHFSEARWLFLARAPLKISIYWRRTHIRKILELVGRQRMVRASTAWLVKGWYPPLFNNH